MTNNSEQLTFMAVHAHPDDEIFGTGGTFAKLSHEGVRTVLITSTRGEAGDIFDPTMTEEQKAETFKHMAEVRERELAEAVAALGITEQRYLDFRDSGMVGTPDNQNPASFHQALFDEAVKRLVRYIREFKPQVMATYDPWGGYGHPDHVQAHRVAVIAFEAAGDKRFYPDLELEAWQPLKLYYTAFARSMFQKSVQIMKERQIDGPWNNPQMDMDEWGVPDELITTTLDVRDFIEQKRAAVRAHRTQMAPDNFMLMLPDDLAREGIGYESFILSRTAYGINRPPQGQQENDLFTGLR
jgi:N-acetyl-1-D-myo-inositol-2-amino-2-deoxy-alpha-D-glucopyranoside deacetylase